MTKTEVMNRVNERAKDLKREIAKTKLSECLFWVEQGLTDDGTK